jgi:hypothetical protein
MVMVMSPDYGSQSPVPPVRLAPLFLSILGTYGLLAYGPGWLQKQVTKRVISAVLVRMADR